MRYIIVGNSTYKTFNQIYEYHEDDYLIGLDVGCYQIINKGLKLNEAWGDFDHINKLDDIKTHAKIFNLFPERKNETDLELILNNLSKQNVIDEIYIYDATGGRLDHELINILLLQKYSNLNVKLIDEHNEISFVSNARRYQLFSNNYKYVGLLTFDQATISIEEAEYQLPKVTITKSDTYTTSNQFINDKFCFTLYEGQLLIIKSK